MLRAGESVFMSIFCAPVTEGTGSHSLADRHDDIVEGMSNRAASETGKRGIPVTEPGSSNLTPSLQDKLSQPLMEERLF